MAVNKENEKLYALMNQAPASAAPVNAVDTAALAAAEAAAQKADYSRTSDGRLDKAISDYLSKSGYRYNIADDAEYRSFAKEYSNNALRGQNSAQETALQLANGYTPTYANAVGSAVQGDIEANLPNYAPTFRQLGAQEQAARVNQAGEAAKLYADIANTGYQRNRDEHTDRMNYLSYLAGKYANDRQAQIQEAGIKDDIYRAQLSSALSDATQARSLDNSRYQFDSQSAQNRASLAENQRQFEEKQAYTAAYDAYKERVAAEKAAAKQQAAEIKAQGKAQAAIEKAAAKDEKAREKIKEQYNTALYKMKLGKDLTVNEMRLLDLDEDGTISEKETLYSKLGAANGVDMRKALALSDSADSIDPAKIGRFANHLKSLKNDKFKDSKAMESHIKSTAKQYGLDPENDTMVAMLYQLLGY